MPRVPSELFTSGHKFSRVVPCFLLRFLTGSCFADTPMVVPVRGYLDEIRRLMGGGPLNGTWQQAARTRRVLWSKPTQSRRVFSRRGNQTSLRISAQRLTSQRHRLDTQVPDWCVAAHQHRDCHADVLIRYSSQASPTAHDREGATQQPPTAHVLDFLAKLRSEPEDDEGSSPDEGVPPKRAEWRGKAADDDRIWLRHTRNVRWPVVGPLADPGPYLSRQR